MKRSLFISIVFLSLTATGQNAITTVKYQTPIYLNSGLTNQIKLLNIGDTVEIRSFDARYKAFLIETKDTIGYVYESNLNRNWDVVVLIDEAKKNQNKGLYFVGMSAGDAAINLGPPDQTIVHSGTTWKSETWYYRERSLYLMFKDDTLTSFRITD